MDVGCGEGWYSCAVTAALRSMGCQTALCGVDISPDILRFAAVRAKQQGIPDADWAVASVNHLPAAAHSCDCILNLFAPCEPQEFLRIIKPNGILLRVIPLEKHLWELKQAVYALTYGDLLMMALYRTRPYEAVPGSAQKLFDYWMDICRKADDHGCASIRDAP